MARAAVTNIGTKYAQGLKKRKGYATLRAATILTTSYVETDEVDLTDFTQIGIMFDLTQGSLTSFEYKVWQSIDGTTWFQEASESVGAGVITDTPAYYTYAFTTSDPYYKLVPFLGRYLKLEVKGTGTVTGSSCAVDVMGVY